MDTWRSEDVTLFPHRNPIETSLIQTFEAHPMDDTFDIEVGGDYLPEGFDGHMESAFFDFSLDRDEAKRLYDELGQWLNEHGGT